MKGFQTDLLKVAVKYPAVYEQTSPSTKVEFTPDEKLAAWRQIAKEMGERGFTNLNDTVQCRRKFKNLRDTFVKMANRFEEVCIENGVSAVSARPMLRYWNHMRFLCDNTRKVQLMAPEIREAFLSTFTAVPDDESQTATSGIEGGVSQTHDISLADLSHSNDSSDLKRKEVQRWSKTDRRLSSMPSYKKVKPSMVRACPKPMVTTQQRAEPQIAVLNESELSEDYFFMQLLAKRFKAIPEGYPKEKLKCDVLKMVLDCQFSKESSSSKCSEVNTSSQADTVTLAQSVDNSQSSLITELSKAMNV